MISPSGIVSCSIAVLCMLGSALATPPPPPLAECAIQFFATGMHGKGVKVSTTRNDDYAVKYLSQRTTTRSAKFDKEKAIVLFEGAIDEVRSNKVDVTLHTDFTADYSGCKFEDLGFGHIIDNYGSEGGSGNCYTIEQNCGHHGTSVYGTVYVDIYCRLPYESESIRMKYNQVESGVDEVLNC